MSILHTLTQLYDRLDRRGVVPLPGYARVGVSFAIPISARGEVFPAIDLRTDKGRAKVPLYRNMPKLRDHNNSGKDPFLFWDNTGYALGLVKKEMKRGTPTGLFESFQQANLDAIAAATSNELKAFAEFLRNWSPDKADRLQIATEHLDSNVAFRSIETGLLIHECAEARAIWQRANQADSAPRQICLVSGLDAPIARLHPKFPALEAGGSRAPIVSFDKSAFTSYDKDQGDNAPVSEEAAFKYGAALSWLLDRSNSRAFRLGETTVVFWADEKTSAQGEDDALAIEDTLAAEFGTPFDAASDDESGSDDEESFRPDVDAEQEQEMARQADDARTQRAAPDIGKLDPNARLHILGLSPNAGRIAVRFWLVDTWGHVADNIRAHHVGMSIEPKDFSSGRKPYALLYETAVQGKAENILPRLGGELARAILSGSPYPRTLFAAVLARIRVDKQINAARAGLCKAIINREHKMEVIPVALNPDSSDGAYNLGRLFASYEYAERTVADRNASIRDKFIGAASATPRRVFPILMRGYEHNASALAKGEGNQRGAGVKASKAVRQILDLFGEAPFPTALALEGQGRFFVGYYHQMSAFYTKASADASDAADDKDTTP